MKIIRGKNLIGKRFGRLTMIKLFPDQKDFVNSLRGAFAAGHRSVLGVASPAFGKTVVAGYISESVVGRGGSVWFLVHRRNLLRQTSGSFWRSKIAHGLITSGKGRSPHPVQVGTIGTVFSRLESLNPPTMLFIDEAHLSRGNMFETVIKWAKDAGSLVIGLTGTPIRLDNKPLGGLYDHMVEAVSTRWLIENGRLSDYEMYSSPVAPDLSSVKTQAGDYNRGDLHEAMDKPHITGCAVSHYKKFADGMIAVCYCVNVAHSKSTAAQFNAAGIPAVHVDASTTDKELTEACEGLASGKYKVLVNCELVIEGFDLSAQVGEDITIECCILLRPTQSKARYLQMVFRALRKKPNPAIILDHAGCCLRHGMPDDPQEWSLEPRKKGSRRQYDNGPSIGVQVCDHCYFSFRSGVIECPNCGEVVPLRERIIEVVEGELERIQKAQAEEQARIERRREQGKARELEELVAVGVERGMRRPDVWGANVWAARQKRKPSAADYARAAKAWRALV